MGKLIINGNHELSGEVKISGNKNSALAVIAATLLTNEEVILNNVPHIADVLTMFELIEQLGSTVIQISHNSFKIKSNFAYNNLKKDNVSKIRGSVLLLAPMLVREQKVEMAPPGGDVIGLRRLDTHIGGFKSLGIDTQLKDNGNILLKGKLTSGNVYLEEASVTATENMIMAAVLCEGESFIYNAACEPHVQDLCLMLNSMGAKIEGIGSNKLTIVGVEKLGGTSFSISPDYMEIGSFIALAVATNSELTLYNVKGLDMNPILNGFNKFGIKVEQTDELIIIRKDQDRKIPKVNFTPKLDDAPWPGFPSDLIPIMCVLATQLEGPVLIHEKMFETRMFFIDNLIKMGADIILCDPHRVVINGISKLKPSNVTSPDIRAGISLLIAALCVDGNTTIDNIGQIERGYEDFLFKLTDIGANIIRY